MRNLLKNNGLSLVLFLLFFFTFVVGQSLAGYLKYNQDQEQHGRPKAPFGKYVTGSHFLEATMENWESEFLQLFTYVLLTTVLVQRGSAESKNPDAKDDEQAETPPEKLPWPVRRGGMILKVYEHSLSIAFFLLFAISLILHAVGGAGEFNEEQVAHGMTERVSVVQYMTTSSFWFESLQNWQSEFLAIFTVVVFTIWLREKDSPESKKVTDPHDKTGR